MSFLHFCSWFLQRSPPCGRVYLGAGICVKPAVIFKQLQTIELVTLYIQKQNIDKHEVVITNLITSENGKCCTGHSLLSGHYDCHEWSALCSCLKSTQLNKNCGVWTLWTFVRAPQWPKSTIHEAFQAGYPAKIYFSASERRRCLYFII